MNPENPKDNPEMIKDMERRDREFIMFFWFMIFVSIVIGWKLGSTFWFWKAVLQ